MLIKVLVTLFIIFALSRVFLRFREKKVGSLAMALWSILWIVVEVFIWWPALSDRIAHSVGIGRGVDALLFIAVVILFYGAFRLYVKIDFIERQLTSLVRTLAIRDAKRADAHSRDEDGIQ